jgi:hypothetical protein
VHARVRFALLTDRGEELTVLQFYSVHRHVDLGDVDALLLAVDEVVRSYAVNELRP